MSADEYGLYYQEKLASAQVYQDFVCEQLHRLGIVLQNMTSKEFQLKRENLLGLEIKHDQKYAETGRLYIETAEKAHPDNPRYVRSGIYREDNSWLYGIGNYEIFLIFAKNLLRHIDQSAPAWVYRPKKPLPTSIGFCVPDLNARKHAARVIDFTVKPDLPL